MSLLQQAPRFDAAAAAVLAAEHFAVEASASPLPSERDQNFLLEDAAGGRFVLKIANASEQLELLQAQNAAMGHAAGAGALCPTAVAATSGGTIARAADRDGVVHFVRLLTWLGGQPLGTLRHRSPALLVDLGGRLADLDTALSTFDHPAIHRDFHWDLAQGAGTVVRLAPLLRDAALRRTIEEMAAAIEQRTTTRLPRLRRAAIHGDANDYNVLVRAGARPAPTEFAGARPAPTESGARPALTESGARPAPAESAGIGDARVTGFIDFGDMVHGYAVADLAIALAYAMLDDPDPLAVARVMTSAYHAVRPLDEADLAVLFDFARLRLCMSVCIAASQVAERPGDDYLAISQAPILRTLPRLAAIPPAFAEASLRQACGQEPMPPSSRICRWLARQTCAPVIALDPGRAALLDLSVGSPLIGGDPTANTEPALSRRIAGALTNVGATAGIGRYGEPRLLYSSPLFSTGDPGAERRTIHLGVDLFVPPGTPVQAPLDGVVVHATDNTAPLDYGPVIILEHATVDGERFYTLYGHLSRESLAGAPTGRTVRAGESFAALGGAHENGGWPPHLHVQLIVDLLGLGTGFPGVCRASEMDTWKGITPDPSDMLRAIAPGDAALAFPPARLDTTAMVSERRRLTGSNLSIGYSAPVQVARGWMQYLFDASGRRYLDAYNNVPHVGHSHPAVVDAVTAQMRVLNTNTRYVHESLSRYAERLTATLPEPLRVCYFVNSGSEANELALRIARAHTGRSDLIVLDAGYHGNTTTLIDISPYKFNGPGGQGARPWVHVATLPDVYRGPYRRDDAGAKYAAEVEVLVDHLGPNRLCGFLAETCPSVGGQILLPGGYLPRVYAAVRGAGGLSIADEVQTAYGRMGSHFYAFEAHGVVPDIVVLGKPIGNGYPLGAVVTTAEIAASFDNGMEFFSTFGGSTVSCAAGLAVLEVVERERLQAHAVRVGAVLQARLDALPARHAAVGDVRGGGLFWGVELVRHRGTRQPAPDEAAYVVNRMRERGVLIGTDGPHHNVLKIRPPMPFDEGDAEYLAAVLDEVLCERGEG